MAELKLRYGDETGLNNAAISEGTVYFIRKEPDKTTKSVYGNIYYDLPDEDKRILISGVGYPGEGDGSEIFNVFVESKPKTATGKQAHAEGRTTHATGNFSHAEGYYCTAGGPNGQGTNSDGSSYDYYTATHAEGCSTQALGQYGAHSEGNHTLAEGDYAPHAEGSYTIAKGIHGPHAEGYYTEATGNQGSHAEGCHTKATGNRGSHAEGWYTVASGENSHAEGCYTKAEGNCSHAEGLGEDNNTFSLALGAASHVEGFATQTLAKYTHAEGVKCIAGTEEKDSQGNNIGSAAHAEGGYTKAIEYCAHAEGHSTTASGDYGSHAEGYGTTASGTASHAEGYNTTASGDYSHAEGQNCQASGLNSHAGGQSSTCSGQASLAVGYCVESSGFAQAIVGVGNLTNSLPTAKFVVGNGTITNPETGEVSAEDRSNAFRVDQNGNCYAGKSNNATGADFAEYFEWKDRNINDEDRRGRLVTLENNKIRLANLNDNYILGAVTTTGAFIGNAASEDWKDKYLTNIFNEVLIEEIEISAIIDEETGEIIVPARTVTQRILNPEYNSELEYVPRENRKEWAPIGLCGQVIIVDDGTCEVNGYCRPYVDGIASSFTIDDIDEDIPQFMKEFYLSTKGFRVVERLDENHIKIVIK